MEKNIISEINRIQKLMGTPVLVLEGGGRWGAFIDNLAGKTLAKGYNFFDILEGYFKNLDNVTDEDIDKIINDIKTKVGLSADEAETLKKLLKEDADFNRVIKSNVDFYTSLKSIAERTVPDYANKLTTIVKKIDVKLTPSQASSYKQSLLNKLVRKPGNPVYDLYQSIKTRNLAWFDAMEKEHPGWLLHNSDEVYDHIDDRLNAYLQKQVADGNISKETAKDIFEQVSTEVRADSAIKNKVDDMIAAGRVSGGPKRTKKPKYGDAPTTADDATHYKNNLVDYKKPPKVSDLKTQKDPTSGVETPIPKSNEVEPFIPIRKGDVFDPEEGFKDLDPKQFGVLRRIWLNYIRPWFYMWLDQFRNLGSKTFEKRKEEFLYATKRAMDEYTIAAKGGSNKQSLNASYKKMMDTFLRLPKNSDIIIDKNINNVYDIIWDDFVEFGQKQFAGDPDGLKTFQSFCSDVQSRNLGVRSASMSDLLTQAKNMGDDVLDINGEIKKVVSDIKGAFEPMTWLKQNKVLEAIYSKIMSGKFMSPREYMKRIAKESDRDIRLVVQRGKIIRTGAVSYRKSLKVYATALFYGYVVLTTISAIFEALSAQFTNVDVERPWNLFDVDNLELGPEKIAKGLTNFITGYLAYDLVTGTKAIDIIQSFFGIAPDKEEFPVTEAVLERLPFGYRDDILIAGVKLISGVGGETKTPEEATNELEKALTLPGRTDIPNKNTDSTDHSKLVEKYLLLPPATRGENPKFSQATGVVLADALRWDSTKKYIVRDVERHNIWVEDRIENKQYYIVSNTNYKPGENAPFLWKVKDGEYKSIDDLASAYVENYRKACSDFCKGLTDEQKSKYFICGKLGSSDIFNVDLNKEKLKKESIYSKMNLLMENTPRTKFGEDNFKHWKDTFVFKAEDEKNPGQFKQVKINMEDVMDRINHYRKKYDEDDAFVRAVLDTHDNVVKVMYTKDLADISESARPRGLALVLRENRGELEIFSVSRPANGNWFLVKGDYTPSQLANMDLEKKEPEDKEPKKLSKTEDDLKKKEEESIILLKRNEKEGLVDLPRKVKQKLKEKISKGWTTEEPPSYLMDFYTTSEVNSVFNDPIEIFKLDPSPSYFATVVKNSARVTPKRGFCRGLYMASRNEELNERQRKTIGHILTRCKAKLAGKFGVASF